MAKAKSKKVTIEDVIIPIEEQPYVIPENWCWVKLEAIVSVVTGKKDANYGSEDGEYTFFTCAGEPIRCEDFSFEGESLLLPGNGANVGQVFYYNGKFEAYQRTYVLQAIADNTNMKYLYYQMLFAWNDANKDKQFGSATNYIKMGNFTTYDVPLPPLAEQKRIVEKIESLFSKLDEAKDKAQEVLDEFESRKAAVLHKALSGELTKKWRLDKGINDNRKTVPLSKCCKIGSGGTPSRKIPEYYDGNIPWIKTGEINWNDIGDAEEHISQEAIDNSSAKIYKPGAVLVAMYGMGITRGRAAILKKEAATNQAVCVLQPNSDLYNKYLFYYFMCNYWEIREKSVGGNQLNLSGTIIGQFVIDIPSFEEQQRVVTILDDIFEREMKVKEFLETILEQIDLMKKSILAKAFHGKLGTNISEEENSIELLKKIIEEG